MGTATTYSTARLVAGRGTSCVLSDWAHNLSRDGWLRGSGVPLPPLRPQSPPEYPDRTAFTRTTPWSRLRLARPPLRHMLREWRPWPLPPTTRPLTGSWAQQLAALTPQCAAKPYRWQHGQAAHTATHRVNVRIGGLRQPPNRTPCTRHIIINLLETPRHHSHCTQHSFRARHVIHSCHNSQSVIHRHHRKAGSHGLFSSIPSP